MLSCNLCVGTGDEISGSIDALLDLKTWDNTSEMGIYSPEFRYKYKHLA